MWKKLLFIGTVSIMPLLGSFVVGAEPVPMPDVRQRAEQALREGLEDVLRALKLILHAVPQYQMPKVLENGDIIIRRQHPDHPRYPERNPQPREGTHDTAG